MAQTLRMAGEKRAYTLTDRGTYLNQGQGLDLAVLCEGDPLLVNPYSVITVNPEKHPGVHEEAARNFADFLVSPEVQETIANFGKDRFGEPLFFVGNAGRETGR
jgi:tungstate transport system substrate-binding protein